MQYGLRTRSTALCSESNINLSQSATHRNTEILLSKTMVFEPEKYKIQIQKWLFVFLHFFVCEQRSPPNAVGLFKYTSQIYTLQHQQKMSSFFLYIYPRERKYFSMWQVGIFDFYVIILMWGHTGLLEIVTKPKF